jgi:hypothetical protein
MNTGETWLIRIVLFYAGLSSNYFTIAFGTSNGSTLSESWYTWKGYQVTNSIGGNDGRTEVTGDVYPRSFGTYSTEVNLAVIDMVIVNTATQTMYLRWAWNAWSGTLKKGSSITASKM